MKRVLLAVALLAPATTLALFGTSFKVGVRDAATGQPLDGAFIVAREFATVGRLHGTDTYCVRADIAPATEPWVTVDLPGAGTDVITRAKALEAFAYRPGYCLARTADGARESSRIQFPVGMPAPKDVLDPRKETRLELRRAAQTPLERILYLDELALGLLCGSNRWSDRSAKAMVDLSTAMLGEARAIANSRYEKSLVQRLEDRLTAARGRPALERVGDPLGINPAPASFASDFLIGPADQRVAWHPTQPVVVVSATPRLQAAQPGMAAWSAPGLAVRPPTAPAALVIHCRHGPPSACDLDERGSTGETRLYATVWSGKVDEAKVLLAAGADPNIPKYPGGPTAIEKALEALMRDHSNAAQMAQLLDLFAADPRTTLPAALKEDFAADPATWNAAAHSKQLPALLQRREALARLPARAEARAGCEALGFTREYRDGPVRLRLPRASP